MNTPIQVVVPQNQPAESGRTVLFVSELPENVSEIDLETFFVDYKESIMFMQIQRVGKSMESIAPRSLTATLIFKDHRRTDEARRGLNLRKLRGKTVRIMWHEKDNSVRYNTQGNLFVKNVPFDVKPREFYEKFLEFGDVISAKLCEDEEGNHNGYGYVSYYSPESTDKAIRSLNGVEVWPGSKLEVARFQRKNERFQNLTVNKNLYVKNLPESYSDKELKELFSKYGTITWSKLMDSNGRKSAMVSYELEESVTRAKDALNGQVVEGTELYVEPLMKKSDRKRILTSRIVDSNYKLNSQFRDCNLHIRNLPQNVDEAYLHEVFSKFGDVKSVKIPKMILVTKVNNQFKEYPMSKGFGYVCFTTAEFAKRAKEEMNNQFLPKSESVKRPLLVDFFMPKSERKTMLNRLQQFPGPKQYPMMSPFGPFGMPSPFNLHPNLAKHVKHQQPVHPSMFAQQHPSYSKNLPPKTLPHQYPAQNQVTPTRTDDPDIKYLQSLEDETAKKDYLGEFIFKKIENHSLAQSNNFTIDTIGKITGMILGIDDINEIVDIAMNNDNCLLESQKHLAYLLLTTPNK